MHASTPFRRPGLIVAVLLLTATASGCLSDPAPEPPAANEAEAPETVEPAAPVRSEPTLADLVPLRFPIDEPLDRTYWHNGSFSADETGLVGGFVTGAFVKHVDLTEAVPARVPTRIQVTVILDAEHIPVVGPTARADPTSNQTLWYESHWTNPAPGRFEFGGIVKRSPIGTLGVSLEAYTPGTADPPRLDYVVQVNIKANSDGIPVGVPVAFPLDDNETVTFQTQEGNQAELLVYAPDERLLDRLFFVGAEQWTVPRGAGGELVVVPILGAGDLRILRDASENATGGALRALEVHRESGERHDITTMDVTTWDFDIDTRPLRVRVTVLGPSGEPWTCVGSLGVVLRAPEGPVLEATADCPSPTNVPFLYAEHRTWTSHAGDARLVPGTYSVTVDNTLWSGHRAYHTVEWYAR